MRTRAACMRESTLLFHLPEALQAWLLTEWVDPDGDLQAVATVLGHAAFRRVVDHHPGFALRAQRILSKACVQWLAAQAIRVEMLKTYHTNGDIQEWFLNGKWHRDGDLPALVVSDGDLCCWYQHGKLHRDGDQPACDSAWAKMWYQRGHLHRDNDLAAWVHYTQHGISELRWFWRGKCHRRKGRGPAVLTSRWAEWWRNGRRLRRRRHPVLLPV